jgi:insulysin
MSITAGLAGLIYDVKILPRGVRLTFGGYNEKLSRFAKYIAKKLSANVRDLLPRNDKEFEKYKDQVMRSLSSFDVKQPYGEYHD